MSIEQPAPLCAIAHPAAFASQAKVELLHQRNLLLSHRGMHVYIQQVLIPSLNGYKSRGTIPEEFYAPELFSSSFIVREQHRLYNQIRRDQGREQIYYKMAADNPRNPVNRADAREEQLIAYFNANRGEREHREIISCQGRKCLSVTVPFLANGPQCLRCHGPRDAAPKQLQALYPGDGGFNEPLGRIRAIESIRVPLEAETRWAWVISAMLLTGAAVFGGLFLDNRVLARRVRDRTSHLEQEMVERQRAEEALSVTQFAVDTMTDAVYRVDREGRILYANGASARLLGYAVDELLAGMTVLELSERLLPKRWSEVWNILVTRGEFHVETNHRRKDGVSIPVEVNASYLGFEQDEFAWIVARDITARRLLQSQFLQAQKMEAIGTLAGGIAHDFNNILVAVRGFADLACESIAPDNPGRQARCETPSTLREQSADASNRLTRAIPPCLGSFWSSSSAVIAASARRCILWSPTSDNAAGEA